MSVRNVRRVRRSAVLLALPLTLAVMAGCGSGSSDKSSSTGSSSTTAQANADCSVAGKKIQFVGPLKSNPALQIMAAGFTSEAKKLGFDSQVLLTDDANPQNILALGKQALVQGSDGIVLLALDPSMYPFIQQASSQGVPVIVTIFPVKGGKSLGLKQDIYPRPDKYGAMVAKAIGKQINGKGTVAVTQGGFNTIENLASAAFTKTMHELYPDVKVLAVEEEGYDPARAVSKAVSILQANPDVNGAFSTTAGGAKTWAGAAGQTNRTVASVAMDYTRQNLDLVKAGKVYGLVGQPLYQEHAYAVDSLKKLICGGSVPYAPDLPIPLVTKANMDDYYAILAKTGT